MPLPVQPAESSGPRVSLTLEDAVQRALENNLDIAVQRIGQQIYDVNIASIRSVYSPRSRRSQHSQLQERVNEHHFRRPDRRDHHNATFLFNGGIAQDVPWGGGNFSAALDNRRSETSN